MTEEIPEEYSSNYETFRDILSSVLIESITAPSPEAKPKSKRRSKRQPTPDTTDPDDEPPSAEDLADFTTYIATTTFLTLPPELQSLTYRHWSDNPSFQETYTLPLSKDDVSALLQSLDPSISDSLTAYGIISPEDSDDKTNTTLSKFFVPVLSSYITELTTPPPASRATRALVSGCEICGRDWVGLGYHRTFPPCSFVITTHAIPSLSNLPHPPNIAISPSPEFDFYPSPPYPIPPPFPPHTSIPSTRPSPTPSLFPPFPLPPLPLPSPPLLSPTCPSTPTSQSSNN